MQSSFVKGVDKGSDTLLISFSAWNTPAGRFRPYRLVVQLPYSNLLVNCPNNAWYLSEIPGLGRSDAAIVDSLKRLVAASGCRRVVSYGGSMGGFGALKYGLELGADMIVVHGVDTLFGLAGSRSFRGIGDTSLIPLGRQEVRSWRGKAARFAGRILLFIGETDIQDGLHAAYFRKLTGIRPHVVRGASHVIEPFVERHYGFARWMREIECDGTSPFIRVFCDGAHVVRQLSQAYRYRYLGVAAARTDLNPSSAWPGAPMLLLIDALLHDDPDTALAIVRNAIRERPDFEYFHYVLVILLLRRQGSVGSDRAGRPRLRILVRRSYVPKGAGADRNPWLQVATRDAVTSYDAFLTDELQRADLLEAGVAAAAGVSAIAPGSPHPLRLLTMLQRRT